MTTAKTRSKRTRRVSENPKPSSFAPISQTLISSEGLDLPLLRFLYVRLVRLHLGESISSSDREHLSRRLGVRFELRENLEIGHLLFGELESRFDVFFSALCNRGKSSALLLPDLSASFDGLVPLLRCCLVVLALSDPDLVLDKTPVLIRIIGRVISFVNNGDKYGSTTFENRLCQELSWCGTSPPTSVSQDFSPNLYVLGPSDPFRPFLRVLVEVFADELVTHRFLREYFIRSVPISSASSSIFRPLYHSILLEMISLHFILTLSEEEGCQNYLNRLSYRARDELRVSEVSPSSSLSLLLIPTIPSAPKILQAHLILLVAEALCVSMASENSRPIMRLGDSYIKAFERSVHLYTLFMSTFLKEGHPIGSKASSSDPALFDRNSKFSFKSHVQESTRERLNDLVARLDSSWDLRRCCKENDGTQSKLLDDSFDYIDGTQVDESFKNDIVSVLKIILRGAFSDCESNIGLYRKGEVSHEGVYLLAAVLKLMSSSMSALTWCLRHDDDNGLRCLEEVSLCKPYDFMANIIGCFENFNVSLPNQKKLLGIIMETDLIRHKTTKWMLLHISGLLSFSFASGFDFLVENCVSTLVSLMNLYVFEEGNLGAMRSLLVPDSKSFSSQHPVAKSKENVRVGQRLRRKIASKIQKIRSELLRHCNAGTEETEKTCNGKIFTDCILRSSEKLSVYDDLMDFIECKAGKDYSSWLNNRKIHRKWRFKKMAVFRRKKKKKACELMAAMKP